MPTKTTRGLEISAESFFLPDRSDPDQQRYTFSYRVHFKNTSGETMQLISRHWIVTDSNGKVIEVKGEGVVGEQPILKPGTEYEYMSGSNLNSPVGSMHGTYQMRTESGEAFDAEIPCFNLSVPGILN